MTPESSDADYLTRLGRGHGAPRVPGDLEDDQGDAEADEGISTLEPDPDEERTRDDAASLRDL